MKDYATIRVDQVLDHPWRENTKFVIRQFGYALIIRTEMHDPWWGQWVNFYMYDASPVQLPPAVVGKEIKDMDDAEREITRQRMCGTMHDSVILKQEPNMAYSMARIGVMWPLGARCTPRDNGVKEQWHEAAKARIKEIINIIFPESEGEEFWQDDNGVLRHCLGPPIYTADLDEMQYAGVDLEQYIGWKVKHDVFGTGTLGRLKCGKFVCHWRTTCNREGCKRRTTFMTQSGCHTGAWCYAVDREGHSRGDLRNCSVWCNDCLKAPVSIALRVTA